MGRSRYDDPDFSGPAWNAMWTSIREDRKIKEKVMVKAKALREFSATYATTLAPNSEAELNEIAKYVREAKPWDYDLTSNEVLNLAKGVQADLNPKPAVKPDVEDFHPTTCVWETPT